MLLNYPLYLVDTHILFLRGEKMAQMPVDEAESKAPVSSLIRRLPLTWWWIATALAVALIIAATFLFLILELGEPLALLILGISIASALSPLVERLDKAHAARAGGSGGLSDRSAFLCAVNLDRSAAVGAAGTECD
jgi:hypothetical protein